MKRYLPFLLFIGIFSSYLAIQVGIDSLDISASQSTKKNQIYKDLSDTFIKDKFKSLKEKSFVSKDLKSKLVLINFWASWCKPCLEELPSIVKLSEKFKPTELQILAISGDDAEDLKKVKKVIKKFDLKMPIILDQSGEIMARYDVEMLPRSILFRDGKVVEIFDGAKTFDSIEMINTFKKHLK